MKANKAQFEAYEKVRESGETNMMDVAAVIQLAEIKLSREQVLDIIYNHDTYKEAYAKEYK